MAHRAVGVGKPRGPKAGPDAILAFPYTAPARAEPVSKNGTIERHIVTQVISAAQANGSFDPVTRQLIVGRVRHYLREIKDPALVQYVLLEIVREQGEHFIPLKHFSSGSFEYIRWRLGYPDGAWRYALWMEQLTDHALHSSVEYWLGRWVDRLPELAYGAAEQDAVVIRCKTMLEKLYSRDAVENMTW